MPFSIGANDEDFMPWTKDLNRFRYYQPVAVAFADPEEVKIGKMTEIYAVAEEGGRFTQRKSLWGL